MSQLYLGLDIGSVSLACVLINERKQITHSRYLFHEGRIMPVLQELLSGPEFSNVRHVCYNHHAAEFFQAGMELNDQIALVEGANYIHREKSAGIFVIGGETFGFFHFDEKGKYKKYIFNSACAAGTGSFLDQQATRIGLQDSTELAALAESYTGDPPKIATRCAVFAKTDLIHCQQQGFSLPAISAGLCRGLAHNIADTLLSGIKISGPVLAIGGVSKNRAVMKHLEDIIGYPVIVPGNSDLAGAIGCAITARSANHTITPDIISILAHQTQQKQFFFPPLTSGLTGYPNFLNHIHYEKNDVETDIYLDLADRTDINAFLGIDIGSTSTKLVVTDIDGTIDNVLLGLYTRTKGQPIHAIQRLFKALADIEYDSEIKFRFNGVATTGSGRKFIQKVIRADLAVDEITAHARAAYQLNPQIDTIIEIGGQDAKFTVLKDGQVTFSVMNYVCAAGTGSFIEEQAKRLHVSLAEFSGRAEGTPAPLTSDRCTVFMERDLNYLLGKGYATEELLAATLHSVRDNYLAKVAHLNKIGDTICFQGATAKNKALVMAFEQRLDKPIFVSRYCHLTGALGAAIILSEKSYEQSKFRGISFYQESPEVREEVCDECKNHCKLRTVEIGRDKITWGYLCGRDESGATKKSLSQKEFDLLRKRRKVFKQKVAKETTVLHLEKAFPIPDIDLSHLMQDLELNLLNLRHTVFSATQAEKSQKSVKRKKVIGIPNALYMTEYLPFWQKFFDSLGYRTVTLAANKNYIQAGKEISGAEFCAPMSKWYGTFLKLKDKVDYLFLPQMFEHDDNKYCYYSNYAAPLIKNNEHLSIAQPFISPIIDFSKSRIENIRQIYDALPDELKLNQTPGDLSQAYTRSWDWFMHKRRQLIRIFENYTRSKPGIKIILLGRPYIVFDPEMNKNIPQIFSDLNIPVFFQDMLPDEKRDLDLPAREFSEWNHWKFGADIIRSAEYIGKHKGLYPVFLTAFKCSPDSFILKYFSRIMDSYSKPYLVLQIDEHDSGVGYETRIEAAIGSFQNHLQQGKKAKKQPAHISMPVLDHKQKTVLIPNYDKYSCDLIRAAFEHAGYTAILIEESETTIMSSLRLNDGQCLPVSSIVQSAVETIKKYHLDPQNTSIFLNAITRLACNFPQYPIMAKKILEDMGDDYKDVEIFATDFEMSEFPVEVVADVYCSYLLGGLLRRLGCRIRPYEIIPGETDQVIRNGHRKMAKCIAGGADKGAAFEKVIRELSDIRITNDLGKRPQVTIIGDLYVRDNDVFNQELIHNLEDNGAEVITTPYTYLLRLMAIRRTIELRSERKFWKLMKFRLLIEMLEKFERKFYKIAQPVLQEPFPEFNDNIINQLDRYKLTTEHGGETAQNLLKIHGLIEHYPDLCLIIHVNPIFCCPGLVSESIFKVLEKEINIPIVSLTYDGTGTRKNEILAPYLHFIRQAVGSNR